MGEMGRLLDGDKVCSDAAMSDCKATFADIRRWVRYKPFSTAAASSTQEIILPTTFIHVEDSVSQTQHDDSESERNVTMFGPMFLDSDDTQGNADSFLDGNADTQSLVGIYKNSSTAMSDSTPMDVQEPVCN